MSRFFNNRWLTLTPGEDVKIPKNFNMPGTGRTIPANTEVAYGYVFTTILAGQISASQGPYETLWLNPDTVAMKAIGTLASHMPLYKR